ncbi:MAG: hypothetical protein EA361_11580 [Bacteroidetes bacterium]|nr:MAG: hypothetical protein EA361_11580 [Bacteroidota bacterium]
MLEMPYRLAKIAKIVCISIEGLAEKVFSALNARRQGEAVYEYRDPLNSDRKLNAYPQILNIPFNIGPAEKVFSALNARRQGEAVYEYREPQATKQMMY